MADRIAALEAEKAVLESHISKSPSTTPKIPTEGAVDDAIVTQIRLDLTESLRSKGVTEGRLRVAEEELTKLRVKSKEDSRSLRDLGSDRTTLITRLKDREHELREKRKLIEVGDKSFAKEIIFFCC